MRKVTQAYLDNNATTEVSHEGAEIIMDIILTDIYGNPSSSHKMGQAVKELIETARTSLAASLNCAPETLFFTGGGTEANNIALAGVLDPEMDISSGVVLSIAEHPSVSNTAKALVGEDRIRIIPLLPDGSLDLEWAERLITDDTVLVSVMLASNETGAIFSVKEVAKLAHSHGAIMHCDAIQAFGKLPIDVEELEVDMLTISGHKAHALVGIGALYVRKGMLVHPSSHGGSQEHRLRPGTENYLGIASLGAVADSLREGNYCKSSLRNAFEVGLTKRIKNIKINAQRIPRVSNTSSVTFYGVNGELLLAALNEKGVYASLGPACSAGTPSPSKALISMGVMPRDASDTLRFSFSKFSKMEETAFAIDMCVECVSKIREVMGTKPTK